MLTASGWSNFLTQAGAGALDLEVLQSDLGKLAWRLHHGHVRSHFLQKIRPYELGFFSSRPVSLFQIRSCPALFKSCSFFSSWARQLCACCIPGCVNHWPFGRFLNLHGLFNFFLKGCASCKWYIYSTFYAEHSSAFRHWLKDMTVFFGW